MRSLFILSFIGLLFVLSIEGKKQVVRQAAAPVPVESVVEEPVLVIQPKIIRPRTLKVLTAYDKCKMECKRQRENEGLATYVEQLKAELAAAEAAIEQENASAEQTNENTAV
ncbi:hypothetical protein PRIPAC_87553 [Pristionchus pacificus]|uniref:Uncharacterized protein n=1 Tax=Pristionchus pacificus TaxID=54126 RepID=A0A454XW23_PRIPA|nr:hypothetical protein PRIPAC_87553 [Pristionchus pacificus]|eukprot:PDM78124.1 hypothetical protein PRIPAC_30509 [Pristionchus pacificus]